MLSVTDLFCFGCSRTESHDHVILKAISTVVQRGAICPLGSVRPLLRPTLYAEACPEPADPWVSWFQRPAGMWRVCLYIERHTGT